LTILYYLTMLGSLVCYVIVLIKLFQAEGALKGILAVICGLYAFVWGWINAARFNLRNIMLAWTALIIAGLAVGMFTGMSAFSGVTPQ
jgi:hypothetical protein